MVLGTGDLSEFALGWCTYGVGDHMSHYNVNASVPKTLIQHLIRWVISSENSMPKQARCSNPILDTEISPELVPHETDDQARRRKARRQKSARMTCKISTYTISRDTGFARAKSPSSVSMPGRIKCMAHGRRFALEKHREYDMATIKKWLEVFLFRFFQISQFKRSCLPNGPKVGSGGSFSPRGDWRAPADSEAVSGSRNSAATCQIEER